jgi:bisanhydrobacterioruberin hydratase
MRITLLDRALCGALVLFFAIGFAGHLLPATRPLMHTLTPLALLFTAGAVAVPLIRERAAAAGAWALAVYVIGFAFEALGVATGLVFGAYSYGTVLGPKLLGVPLIIGLNWAMVILGAVSFTTRFLRHPLAAAAAAGALTAGFDWVLEPVAVSSGYWRWAGGVIPLQNSIAWFLIAAALAFLYASRTVTVRTPVASAAFAVQLLFFTLLRAAGA